MRLYKVCLHSNSLPDCRSHQVLKLQANPWNCSCPLLSSGGVKTGGGSTGNSNMDKLICPQIRACTSERSLRESSFIKLYCMWCLYRGATGHLCSTGGWDREGFFEGYRCVLPTITTTHLHYSPKRSTDISQCWAVELIHYAADHTDKPEPQQQR